MSILRRGEKLKMNELTIDLRTFGKENQNKPNKKIKKE